MGYWLTLKPKGICCIIYNFCLDFEYNIRQQALQFGSQYAVCAAKSLHNLKKKSYTKILGIYLTF